MHRRSEEPFPRSRERSLGYSRRHATVRSNKNWLRGASHRSTFPFVVVIDVFAYSTWHSLHVFAKRQDDELPLFASAALPSTISLGAETFAVFHAPKIGHELIQLHTSCVHAHIHGWWGPTPQPKVKPLPIFSARGWVPLR